MTPQLLIVLFQLKSFSTLGLFRDPVISQPSFSTFQPNEFSCHVPTLNPINSNTDFGVAGDLTAAAFKIPMNSTQNDNSDQESVQNLGHYSGTDSLTTFANSESNVIGHSDRLTEFNLHGHIVTRHAHFSTTQQGGCAGYVGRSEVELWAITAEERRCTTTFFFAQHVHLAFKL